MQHYTIDTGHCRDAERSEVVDEAIAILSPLLRDGQHPLPRPFSAYSLRVTIAGRTLAATVFSGDAPLVTTFVCLDQAGLDEVRQITGAIPAVKLRAPAILVQPQVGLALDRDAIGWLGDFERCLGWAWVEHCEAKWPSA